MARILSNELLEKFKENGEYVNILKEVNKDKDLSLEIREGKAIVYYKKGKILTLSSKKIERLSSGYYKDGEFKFSDAQIKQNPKAYFAKAKSFVDAHGNKKEFTIQQLIVSDNLSIDNDYLVVDMEYQYKQSDIPKSKRLPLTRIDLLAVEKDSKDIILFELKQGINALNGESGIDDHINKMNELVKDKRFREALIKEIKNIIEQKVELQILPEGAKTWINETRNSVTIRPMFIFIYSDEKEREVYDEKLRNRIPTIYLNPKYILKKPE